MYQSFLKRIIKFSGIVTFVSDCFLKIKLFSVSDNKKIFLVFLIKNISHSVSAKGIYQLQERVC